MNPWCEVPSLRNGGIYPVHRTSSTQGEIDSTFVIAMLGKPSMILSTGFSFFGRNDCPAGISFFGMPFFFFFAPSLRENRYPRLCFKKNFFDGREQNGEAQQKAMKLHQESLGRAETPEALDGFVIMREGDSSARRKRTSLYMRGKKLPPGDMENL